MKKILIVLITYFLLLPIHVYADSQELIIHDNGDIQLGNPSTKHVLGIATESGTTQTTNLKLHRKHHVRISPPINDGQQIQVVVTTEQPTQPISTSVDKVVAEGAKGQPVITITSGHARELTIQQGSTHVTTSLPLQIDTTTHALSIPIASQDATINVLPKEAVQEIIHKGLLNTQEATQATVSLTRGDKGITYTIDSKKQGKLLGIVPITSSTQVQISAENGKVITGIQPFFSTILKSFIK